MVIISVSISLLKYFVSSFIYVFVCVLCRCAHVTVCHNMRVKVRIHSASSSHYVGSRAQTPGVRPQASSFSLEAILSAGSYFFMIESHSEVILKSHCGLNGWCSPTSGSVLEDVGLSRRSYSLWGQPDYKGTPHSLNGVI